MDNIKYFYLGGDLHGNWRPVRNWVVNNLPTDKTESALILLGDVGANYFGDKRDREFKNQLNKLQLRIYCMRGNHEMRVTEAMKYGNYSEFYDNDVGGKVYVEEGFPYIRYFTDNGGYYMIQNKRTLIVPGAYSIDKYYRLQMGWNWFPDEQLSLGEQTWLSILAHDIDFDYILAHTCPHSWEPYIDDLFINGLDQSKIDKTTEDFLDNLLDDCSYQHFYFGHFHNDRDIPQVNATMLYKKFIPLGCNLNQQVDE